MYDEHYENGYNKIFMDINQYMSLRSSLVVGTDRFFLAILHDVTHRKDFFKHQHVDKNTFLNLIENSCGLESIEGSGSMDWMSTHGLRDTVATLLFKKGH